MSKLVSKTMQDLEVGMQGSYSKTLTERDIMLFGETSGDINPVHFDDEFAAGTIFKERIAHGMWSASLISTCLGTVMPGPGSLYLGQTLEFKAAVKPGDELTVTATIKEKQRKILIIDCEVKNQLGEIVVSGEAKAIPARKAIEVAAPVLPDIKVAGLDA